MAFAPCLLGRRRFCTSIFKNIPPARSTHRSKLRFGKLKHTHCGTRSRQLVAQFSARICFPIFRIPIFPQKNAAKTQNIFNNFPTLFNSRLADVRVFRTTGPNFEKRVNKKKRVSTTTLRELPK